MFRWKRSLWDRWREQRDPAAFRALVQRHSGMVLATCRRMLRDHGAAEEVTQECFVALAQSTTVRADAVGAWLYGVATRQCLHRLRTDRRRLERENVFAEHLGATVMSSWNDVEELIDAEIAELPEELRKPVIAHFVEGKSHASIAREMGIPRRTVSHRIERGVELTSEGLRKKGIAVGGAALSGMLGVHLAEAFVISPSLNAVLAECAAVHGNTVSTVAVATKTASAMKLALGALAIGVLMIGGGAFAVHRNAVSGNTVTAAASERAAIVGSSTGETADLEAVTEAAEEAPLANEETTLVASGLSIAPVDAASSHATGGVFAEGAADDASAGDTGSPTNLPVDTTTDGNPTVESVVAALSRTLEVQNGGYALQYRVEERRTSTITSQANKFSGSPRMLNEEGEVMTDGRRVVWKSRAWGQAGDFNFRPRTDPTALQLVYDGQEVWRYTKDAQVSGMPHGFIVIERNAGEVMNEALGGFPGAFLLGHISLVWYRIDKILAESTATLRPARVTINGAACDVVDFESRYGRGTLWVDPEHGHCIAAANVNLRTGDTANGTITDPNANTDLGVHDVKFKKVDDVWYPVSGILEVAYSSSQDSETSTRNVTFTTISRSPKMDEALSCGTIDEGAYASYLSERNWYQWRGGKLVPSGDPYENLD